MQWPVWWLLLALFLGVTEVMPCHVMSCHVMRHCCTALFESIVHGWASLEAQNIMISYFLSLAVVVSLLITMHPCQILSLLDITKDYIMASSTMDYGLKQGCKYKHVYFPTIHLLSVDMPVIILNLNLYNHSRIVQLFFVNVKRCIILIAWLSLPVSIL